MYGSSLRLVTRTPREARIAASDAAAMPFPSEETTPPVTNTNLVMGAKVPEIRHFTGTAACATKRGPRPRCVRCSLRRRDPAAIRVARRVAAEQRQHGVDRRRLRRAADQHAQRHHHLRRLRARASRAPALSARRSPRASTSSAANALRELGQRRPVAASTRSAIASGAGSRRRVEVVRGVRHLGQRRDAVAQQHRDARRGRARASGSSPARAR